MLTEVNKAPTKQEIQELKSEYKKVNKKYTDAKYRFNHAVETHDWEILTVSDFLKMKELYIMDKKLYWKIYSLEHPDDTATVEAYAFLNRLGNDKSNDFLASHRLTTHELIHEIQVNPNFLNEVEI